MKVIFLDIDGVLNSTRSAIAFGRGMLLPSSRVHDPKFDPVAVGMLREVIKMTDAKIVISSTWRYDVKIEDWGPVFDLYGWDTRGIVVGHTPDLPGAQRGQEVCQWLMDNNDKISGKYAIVDDTNSYFKFQEPFFVGVNPLNGLSVRNLIKIKKLLSD